MGKAKHEHLQDIVALIPPGTIAIETGRIRSKRKAEGFSTKWLAECPNIEVLYSVDHNPMTQLVCRELIDTEHRNKVWFINADSQNALLTLAALLPSKSVGFLLLDSANDSLTPVQEFLAILPALAKGCIIAVDDVYCEYGFKGGLLLPKFEKNGYKIERRGDYAVVRFGKQPQTE